MNYSMIEKFAFKSSGYSFARHLDNFMESESFNKDLDHFFILLKQVISVILIFIKINMLNKCPILLSTILFQIKCTIDQALVVYNIFIFHSNEFKKIYHKGIIFQIIK